MRDSLNLPFDCTFFTATVGPIGKGSSGPSYAQQVDAPSQSAPAYQQSYQQAAPPFTAPPATGGYQSSSEVGACYWAVMCLSCCLRRPLRSNSANERVDSAVGYFIARASDR